ncbi:MAG: hypothetical protein KA419_10550 [Acidobacteria bacterium]|nr:hypothetical protein [Acidobacteriota bacterium]
MTFKDSTLYHGAGIALMLISAGLFFWKVAPCIDRPLVFATASILCMVSAGILFVLHLASRAREAAAEKDRKEPDPD